MTNQDVFSYILGEEKAYQTKSVAISDGYNWSMYDHIKKTVLYKNSTYFKEQNQDHKKPFFNIILPILNLQYRATGFDVKDIELYVDEVKNYFKSFLIRKYHNRWATEKEMDTFIDETVESYVDFGGTLIKNLPNEAKPEVVPLQRIAFCDQTDLLGGALCEKHHFLPHEMEAMKKKGWRTESVDTIIEKAAYVRKETDNPNDEAETPTKYAEVYELHGDLPEEWLEEGSAGGKDFVRQLQIVAFYKTDDNKRQGVTLFSGEEKKDVYDSIIRDPVYGRALGRGGAEELFDPQVWVNYSVLRQKAMLDAASKVIYQTSDKTFAAENDLDRMDNNEIVTHKPNQPLTKVDTYAPNIALFTNALEQWNVLAETISSAHKPVQGQEPKSGTPFKLQELVTAEGHSLHEYRKGKIATGLDRIWRNWIIPRLGKEVSKGVEFLAELDFDELDEVMERIVTNRANKMVKERILQGELVNETQVEIFKDRVREEFRKGGTKRFLKILKGEFKDLPLAVKINIAGKQRYLPQITDKLVNVFRQVLANPTILQNKPMAKLFNQIIESSGLSPLEFSGFTQAQPAIQQPTPQMAPTP